MKPNGLNQLPHWVTFAPIFTSIVMAFGTFFQIKTWYDAKDFSSIQFPFLFANILATLLNILVALEIRKVTRNNGNLISLLISLFCSCLLVCLKLIY